MTWELSPADDQAFYFFFQGGRGIDAHRTNDIRIGLLIMFHHASWYLQLLSHVIYSSFPATFCYLLCYISADPRLALA